MTWLVVILGLALLILLHELGHFTVARLGGRSPGGVQQACASGR